MAGKHSIEALKLYHQGYNCAQAVVLPFCDELNIDKQTAARAIEGFGGGMGCHELTCGALSGAIFVAGLKSSGCTMEKGAVTKQNTYDITKKLVNDFRTACGSDSCPVIKGIATGKATATCDKCVMTAADLVEKL